MTDGFLPRWTLKTEGTIMPDERLPMGQTLVAGFQHVVAMFGATALAPILMGFDPNVSILFSGIATLIFFVVVGGRVPSYLGSSFAFIGPVLVATGATVGNPNPNIPMALGGIIAAGALYAVIGLIVHVAGHRWVERLMPPVVTGAIVAAIGLVLAPIAINSASGVAPDNANGIAFARWIALLTVIVVGMVAVYAPGIWRRIPILLGGAAGYVGYLILANGMGFGPAIDFAKVGQAAWFGLPTFQSPVLSVQAISLIAPVAIILVAENLGHIKAISAMTGRNLDPYLGRAFMGDGNGRWDRHHALGLRGWNRHDDLRREHGRHVGHAHLLDPDLHRRRGSRGALGTLAEVRCFHLDDPHVRPWWFVDRRVRAHRRDSGAHLGRESSRLRETAQPDHRRRRPGARRR
jgi:putative pyrimidine permease RutG